MSKPITAKMAAAIECTNLMGILAANLLPTNTAGTSAINIPNVVPAITNKGTAIHILKTLAGHRSISTTAAYLYSSPSQLKAAVELV